MSLLIGLFTTFIRYESVLKKKVTILLGMAETEAGVSGRGGVLDN